jgi:transcriptional regulator with XRE-family HTH domain
MSVKDYLPENIEGLTKNKEDALDLLTKAVLYNFKDKLKRQRKNSNLKQSDLAEMVGLKQPAISRIENHDNTSLSLTTLQQIAIGMDCVLVVDIVPHDEMVNKIKKED